MSFKCKERRQTAVRNCFLCSMTGETNLQLLIKNMRPLLNNGEYVFISVNNITSFDISKAISFFKEKEGYTIILEKHIADEWEQPYQYVAAWITLTVYSALEAVGLTAVFATALGNAGISCNVIAAYYHDHIFVDVKDANKAIDVLSKLSGGV